MNFEELQTQIRHRLEQSDRGDRGWWILTRVHVSMYWIKGIVDYLFAQGGTNRIVLSDNDYQKIARISGVESPDPGIQLRRHHLLVLDKPLQFIRREGRYWEQGIYVTNLGVELANSSNPSEVIEKALNEIRFARAPWTPPNRINQYNEFDTHVYRVTKAVVNNCDGYVDRDEFDLFLSRVRNNDEITTTIKMIHSFRSLKERQKKMLLSEVRDRMPSAKTYQNWRDMGLHTFSLFSLGTSFVRRGSVLTSTTKWADEEINLETTTIQEEPPRAAPQLKIPEPKAGELELPPVTPVANDGTDAESFVAKVFGSKGWSVSFYTNKRGYGFDLWARKPASALVIEVKSSIDKMGTVVLTENEYSAAHQYRENFILAIVEFLDTDDPKLTLIQNPATKLNFRQRETITFTVTREEWSSVG